MAARDESPRLQGFTLIEVLVTVTILAIGIVVVLEAINASLLRLDISRDAVTAAMLGRERIAEIETAVLDPGADPVGVTSGFSHVGNREYQWERTVEELSGAEAGSGSRLLEVTVAIRRPGSRRTRELTTYVRSHDNPN